jgi:hypothetical protein
MYHVLLMQYVTYCQHISLSRALVTSNIVIGSLFFHHSPETPRLKIVFIHEYRLEALLHAAFRILRSATSH